MSHHHNCTSQHFSTTQCSCQKDWEAETVEAIATWLEARAEEHSIVYAITALGEAAKAIQRGEWKA